MINTLKIALVSLILFSLASISKAHELGIRGGLNWGNIAAIDAVFKANRLASS